MVLPKDSPNHAQLVDNPISVIYIDFPQWPLEQQEAMLFRHFIENLSPSFDMCDPAKQFGTTVPRRAATCPPLMNAILASSAKRWSRDRKFDALTGDRYHQKCLDALIPALSNTAALLDENLLAAIVILRYMEEVDVPIGGTSFESHLLGTRIFIAAQDKLHDFTGLRMAAFWIALRQEIVTAFIQARPVHANFALDNMARFVVLSDDNDCGFANLTVIRCATCLRYCYGGEAQSVMAWESLRDSQKQWWDSRPWTFYPTYSEDLKDTFFPEEVYLNEAVVTGVHHHFLAEVLLEAHNPKIPKLGPGQAIGLRQTNTNIKELVRRICGIAEVCAIRFHTEPSFLRPCLN